MTITEFQNLAEVEQEEQLNDHGTFLLNYYRNGNLYDVYKLHKFFVKIAYNTLRNKMWAIMAMTGTDDSCLYENDFFPFSGN